MPPRVRSPIFKVTFGASFSSIRFGPVAEAGLSFDFVLNDLTMEGSLAGGGGLGPVDLVNLGCTPTPQLQAGDANQDLQFDQQDIVQVLSAAKYLTGSPATWGEGDFNGAPGGTPGSPPAGDGVFDQRDITAALAAAIYQTGPYGHEPRPIHTSIRFP